MRESERKREILIKKQFPVTFQLFQQITIKMYKNIIKAAMRKVFQCDFVAFILFTSINHNHGKVKLQWIIFKSVYS